MPEAIIHARENLVNDGEFLQGLKLWQKQGRVDKESEPYQGKDQSFLAARNEGKAWQDITLPKSSADDTRYVLSFLWETRHTQPGLLSVHKNGVRVEHFELPPGNARDREQDQIRLNAGLPLDLKPNLFREPLMSSFVAGDVLRIEISSPKNAPSSREKVCITCIDLQLELDEPKVQSIILDEHARTAGAPLYLCLGSEILGGHRVRFCLADDSPWLGTQAALAIANNPMGAVTAEPRWETNQPLTDEWLINCPLLDDAQDYAFTLNLINQYTAEPYAMQVSLGHHRLVCQETREAAYYPLLGESVSLGVKVVSPYTGQGVGGRTVNWSIAGDVIGACITDQQGWAYIDYSPTSEHVGDVVIQASVASPYDVDGVAREDFAVKVLAESPWLHLVIFENGVITEWPEDGYPNRGSAHIIDVSIPRDNPLQDLPISLHWSGDPADDLGIAVEPALGEWQEPAAGLRWSLAAQDKVDGQFGLFLVCSRLLKPSPIKRMFLARNKVEIGEVREADRSPVLDENESALLRLQVIHHTDSGEKNGVIGAQVEWSMPGGKTVHTTSGCDGWAGAWCKPLEVGETIVDVSVRAHSQAPSVPWSFKVNAIATSPWNSRVRILLDGVEVERNTLGLLCHRGQKHELEILPLTEDWRDRNVSLHWRGDDPRIGLHIPELDVARPITGQGLRWTLDATESDVSSLFQLRLHIDGNEADRELTGRLFWQEPSREMSLMLDQIHAALDTQAFYPCLAAAHDFKVLPQALSPLTGLDIALIWSGTAAEELDAQVFPALDSTQKLTDGGFVWSLDFSRSARPGKFQLTVSLPQLALSSEGKPMDLAHNKLRIAQWHETTVTPVVGGESLCLWARVISAFSGLGVGQVPVQWKGSAEQVEPTDEEGWSAYAYAPAAAGEQAIIAAIFSPYNASSEQRSMKVRGLASDPWKGLTISVDRGEPQAFGEKVLFARRSLDYRIEVNADEGSQLFERNLSLGIADRGPSAFGIRGLDSVLGVPKPFSDSGLVYEFSVGDENNGSFGFYCAAEDLASLSPIHAVSVGEGSQMMTIAERSRVLRTLFWGDTVSEQITLVSIDGNKPMRGTTVVWSHPDFGERVTTTDYYGVARIAFVPTSPGAWSLTARAGDGLYSESLSLPFFLHEPRVITELVSDDPSGYPGQNVSARAYVVSAITGNPLASVEVSWEFPGVDIAPTTTDSEGIASVMFRLSDPQSCVLYAAVPGGRAGWDVRSMQFTLKAHERLMTDISGTGSYPVDQAVPVSFRLVSIPGGEPIAGQKVLWVLNSSPDGSSFSTTDGSVQKSYSSQGMVGYKIVRASVVDEKGTVLDEEVFRLRFFDSELP